MTPLYIAQLFPNGQDRLGTVGRIRMLGRVLHLVGGWSLRGVKVGAALLVAACGGPPHSASRSSQYSAPPPNPTFTLEVMPGAAGPYPANYRELVSRAIVETFFDPYSVRNAAVTKPIEAMSTQPGWLVCLTANAKNAYGAYAGQQVVVYFVRAGRIDETFPYQPSKTVPYPGGEAIAARIDSLSAQAAMLQHQLAIDLCRTAVTRGLTTFSPLSLGAR